MEKVELEIRKLVEKYGKSEDEQRRLEMDLHFFMTVVIRQLRKIQEPEEILGSRRFG